MNNTDRYQESGGTAHAPQSTFNSPYLNGFWSNLRYAELSGADYIFIPSQINPKLNDPTFLNSVLPRIYEVADSEPGRAKLYVVNDRFEMPSFYTLSVETKSGGRISGTSLEAINSREQVKFMHTLYSHSAA